MTARLLVQAEPFEAYSEIPGEVQAESSRGRSGLSRSGGRRGYSRRQPQTPPPSAYSAGQATYGARQPSYPVGSGWPYGRPSRWPWRGPVSTGINVEDPGSASDGSESINRAQQCLRQLIGPSVPQTGRIGKATRRAIRIFQKRQGLPVTGRLDGATGAALQAACGGTRRRRPARMQPPPAPPSVEPAPPEDAGAPEPAPADDAAPDGDAADSGTDAAGAEPANDGDSEISAAEREQQTEQEFLVSDACEVRILRHDRVPLSDMARLKQAAQAPGVYIIHVDGHAFYVGVAERTVYLRIKERMKTLRDFNIPASALANRTVAWVSVVSGSFPSCSIRRRDRRNASGPYRPLKGVYAVLKILEQYFIKKLDTGAVGKGNALRENVVFAPGGSLTIHEDGKRDIKVSGKDLS
jgi:peptidoglycan hydrolase-like protein with peptidoglycan-binding domain